MPGSANNSFWWGWSGAVLLMLGCAGCASTQASMKGQAPITPTSSARSAAVAYYSPYARNHFLFSNADDAAKALSSPDIQMRRSGIEYFADFTEAGMYVRSPNQEERRAAFRKRTEIIPQLTLALQEMPVWDVRLAARLLSLFGSRAKSAVPTLCVVLTDPMRDKTGVFDSQFVNRDDLINSLTHLCGGLDKLAPTLTDLLHDSHAETRRAIAEATQYCDNAAFPNASPAPQEAYRLPYEEGRHWGGIFARKMVPALTSCLNDQDASVGIAAAKSLTEFTRYQTDIPWQAAVAPFVKAAESSDKSLRLAALQALACVPADVSVVAASIRAALQTEEPGHSYAIAALSHAVRTGRERTTNVFLGDLKSPNVVIRRRAAADIHQVATLLWNGEFRLEQSLPLPDWWNDNRLFTVSYHEGSNRRDVEQQRAAEVVMAQNNLLSALVSATSDSDLTVSREAALSIEKVGEWTNAILGHGGRFPEAIPLRDCVFKALSASSNALMRRDAPLALRLQKLSERITGPHVVF